jgi:hypothetical protein
MDRAWREQRRSTVFLPAVVLTLAGLLASAPRFPAGAAGGEVGNVSGSVVDARSGTPLAGATIGLSAATGSFTARTDSAGFFALLGVTVDTYVLTISAQGYEGLTLPGVTVQGDQLLALGSVRLTRESRTIGHVVARTTSGAFQPAQTIDSYTLSGPRIIQTTGKAQTTDENALLLAVPGVTLANSGIPTIRGGAAREVGYQYDGVPFAEPYLSSNGSGGLFNGVGSVQVVEGAGDPTQGNVGSGIVNVIPKRGTSPAFGLLDVETGGPGFAHQAAFEYGVANARGTLSDYVAYNGQRFVPYYGYTTTNVAAYLNYFGSSYQANDQFTNNLVYKFGKGDAQQLQLLYANISLQQWGNAGGLPQGRLPGNPNALAYYPYDTLAQSYWIGIFGRYGLSPQQYASNVGLGPGVPDTNVAITQPQVALSLQTRLLKIEYDDRLGTNAYLALRYYNWEQLQYVDNQYSLGPATGGSASNPSWSVQGGPTSGMSLDLMRQAGSKLTITLNAQYDVVRPVWDGFGASGMTIALSSSASGADNPRDEPGPSLADWLPGGYLSKYFPGGIPRIPIWGISYNKTFFQGWGTGIRFQYRPLQALRVDAGIRYEGQDQHWFGQLEQYGQGVPGNVQVVNGPYDVLSSFWQPDVLHPREWEPRVAVAYDMGASDALRLGYGRSAVFGNGASTGTPFNIYNVAPFMKVPPLPGFQCGIPSVKLFPCQSYGEQLYWIGDQVETPDAGNGRPALYSNYDLSYSHQFRSGYGLRVTPFYKLGTNLPTFSLVTQLPGGGSIFSIASFGFNRTTGAEASLTTPERPFGFSGFLSATYQNVLSTTPPLASDETALPFLTPATLALGDIYRAGYVTPFSIRTGGTYVTRSGFSATPVLQYGIGYPYSQGNLIAAQLGPNRYANVPQVDFGAAVPVLTGIGTIGGTALSTNYYDPAFSSSLLHPNVAASRGTPATAANGGYLSAANLHVNLTLQYKRRPNTIGIQFLNAFGNAFNASVPAVNPFYQPVANGLAGPQTNYNVCKSQGFGTARGCTEWVPRDTYAFVNGAYLLTNGNFTNGLTLAPLQPMTVQLFFQHQL